MIEFRWVKVGMDHKDYNDSVAREVYHFDGPPLEISTEDVVLQWRTLVPYMAAHGDVVMSNTQWTDWQTVPFETSNNNRDMAG